MLYSLCRLGHGPTSALPQVMRLRRAVLKIPAKASVLPRLPLHKNRSVKTPSKSTLPQLLIPLHFNSRISNTYKKRLGEAPTCNPKVCQLFTIPSFSPSFEGPLLFTPSAVCEGGNPLRARTPATPIPSMLYFITRGHPGGWGPHQKKLAHSPTHLSYHRLLNFQSLDLQVPRSREAA
jgi:hypothetical protein